MYAAFQKVYTLFSNTLLFCVCGMQVTRSLDDFLAKLFSLMGRLVHSLLFYPHIHIEPSSAGLQYLVCNSSFIALFCVNYFLGILE